MAGTGLSGRHHCITFRAPISTSNAQSARNVANNPAAPIDTSQAESPSDARSTTPAGDIVVTEQRRSQQLLDSARLILIREFQHACGDAYVSGPIARMHGIKAEFRY
jgi:hypothetical protein